MTSRRPWLSLRLRFTFALTAVGVALFGSYAFWAYHSEQKELLAAASRELAIVGRSLETALANALRDSQPHDVEETVETLETLAPELDVHVFDTAGRAVVRSRGAESEPPLDHFVERARRAEATLVDRAHARERLIFTAPLLSDDRSLLGSLAIARPLDDLDQDLSRTRDRLVAMVVLFLVVTMAAGMVLGTVHMSRPISRLLDGFRDVRAGNFRNRIHLTSRDELGQLVAEFNAMIDALANERTRAANEAEARARVEQGLQRVDKLVTIGQLSAGLAHEIGSPLQVLSGRATVLLEHQDPEVRRQAEQLVAQCARITQIVEQLLSFGRRKAAARAACDLVEPVRAVIDLLAGERRRRGIALAMEIEGDALVVDGDRDQIQQIALNLVRNALSATQPGGKVTVRLDRLHDRVRLSVRDTGVGIAPEVKSRLFEPFFTTRASEGGTGLGLAVVRAIADEHDARIDVISEPGGGAEFVVSFPRSEAPRG